MDSADLAQRAWMGAERFREMVLQADNMPLDYTRASVDRLSDFVSANRERWQRMEPTMLHKFTELLGCYYGELVRYTLEGGWVWWGENAAVRVNGRPATAGADAQIHFALPFANVHSHLTIGEEKSLRNLYNAFEALVHGRA